jgi:hypothetical protein
LKRQDLASLSSFQKEAKPFWSLFQKKIHDGILFVFGHYFFKGVLLVV